MIPEGQNGGQMLLILLNTLARQPKRSYTCQFFILLFSLILLTVPVSSANEARAYVRLNQIGYETGHSARAYLMLKGSPASTLNISIVNEQGTVVSSVQLGPSSGSWAGFAVYPLDFTLTTPGTYSITTSGSVSAKSDNFRVDSALNLYSGALSNALAFFQNQSDGADFIPSPLRTAPAHLNDKSAKVYETPHFSKEGRRIDGQLQPTGATIDASGGWWDAGDYLKFVHTTSYTVALMLLGIRDFPNQLGHASQKSDFTKEAKFGLEWLLRMWDDHSKTLYYQVGIGSSPSGFENDHSIWRLPQDDDSSHRNEEQYLYIRNRPVFIAGPAGSKISPNLAGRLAADFALCFTIYKSTDAAFANQCLLAAQHIFDLADTEPAGQLITAAPYDFYGETEWRDDLEFAAAELYLATKTGALPDALPHADPNFYLRAATKWAAAYIAARQNSSGILGIANVSTVAHFDLVQAIASAPKSTELAVSSSELLSDLKKTLDLAATQSASDPFGYGVPWGSGDTPTEGASLAVLASAYSFLSKSPEYSRYADHWLANILGTNAWGISFIVGDGSVFPHCIHHQVANLVGSNNGQPPVLAGAVVEGSIRKMESGMPRSARACPPDGADPYSQFDAKDASYRDNVKFYSTNEPALDLTAPTFLMFAWKIAGAPSR
jgi:endoglucanase